MAVRECRECGERMTAAEYPAHRAAHRAAPARSTRMLKPCNRCKELIPSQDYHRHLQAHATKDPNRPRSRSGTYRWQQLRAKVIKRDGGRCTAPGCGSRENLQVHHIGGGALWKHADAKDRELVPMSELRTLCRACHDAMS
jgi:5-methylcytosine-specific restriction endonuclease McrA